MARFASARGRHRRPRSASRPADSTRKVVRTRPSRISSPSESGAGEVESPAPQVRPVLASEVLERGLAPRDQDPRVAARDRRRFEPGDAFVEPAQDVLALMESDLAIVQEETETKAARRGRSVRVLRLRRLSTEGVAEAVDRPNEAGTPRFVAQRRPQLGHDAREARLRHDGPRPEVLRSWALDKARGRSSGAASRSSRAFGPRWISFAPAKELAAPEVDREVAEMEDQRCPRAAGRIREPVQDFLILVTDLR